MNFVQVASQTQGNSTFLPPDGSDNDTLLVISSKRNLSQADLEFMCEPVRKKIKRQKSSRIENLFAGILEKLNKSDEVEDKIMKTVSENNKLLKIQTRLLQQASNAKFLPPRKKIIIEEPVKPSVSNGFLDMKSTSHITKTAYEKLLRYFISSGKFPSKTPPSKTSSKDVLLMTLLYLCDNISIVELSQHYKLASATVRKLIHAGINLICSLEEEIVKWPSSFEIQLIERQFAEISRFPDIIGVMGGIHIPTRPLSGSQSIYLLAVCDANKNFTYVSAGNHIFLKRKEAFPKSSLAERMKNEPKLLFPSERYHIIGDSSVDLETHVMIPYPFSKKLTSVQRHFNLLLADAKKVISDAFLMLRTNFKRLQYVDADLEYASKIILACCLVHNFMISPPTEITLSEKGQNNLVYSKDFFLHPNLSVLKREKISTYLSNQENCEL